jgi:Histone methylation protein DOT1
MRVDQSARDARRAPKPPACADTNFASASSVARLTESRWWMLIRSLHRRLRFAVWWVIDRSLGVRTTSVEPSGLVEVEQDEPRYSKPSGWFTLYRVFRWLDVGPDDVMIDFGSGTGRAVLVASLFPFRGVVGVELVEQWHRCAEANLAHFRLRRRAPVELHCANALEYAVPDEITVVFLYNPFHGETFRGVVENVFASFDRAPRRLRIVYLNP